MKGKLNANGERCVLKVICGYHDHDLAQSLIGHPFIRRLNPTEKLLLVDMTKSQVKLANILLTLKQNSDCNVIIIKQIHNAKYTYKQLLRGLITELQQLIMMSDRDKYIHWSI